MSILAICGGLRNESNTNKLVKKVAESSGCDYELVYLGKLEIKPCVGCPDCMMNEGKCPIDDDMQELYEKLLNADAIILGSPTYYMDISGAVKSLIDRSLALYYRGIGPMYNPDMPFLGQRPLAGKLGVVVTTVAGAGHERALETLTFLSALQWAPNTRVNGIASGFVIPPIGMDSLTMEKSLKKVPSGKPVSVKDICSTCVYLAETESVTGQIIYLDGGAHL